MVETEGMLNTRTGEYDFIGRSIPIFPQNDLDVPAGEKAYIKVKAPFCDRLSGMICTKFFGRDIVYTLRVVTFYSIIMTTTYIHVCKHTYITLWVYKYKHVYPCI